MFLENEITIYRQCISQLATCRENLQKSITKEDTPLDDQRAQAREVLAEAQDALGRLIGALYVDLAEQLAENCDVTLLES